MVLAFAANAALASRQTLSKEINEESQNFKLSEDGVIELWRADSYTLAPPDKVVLPGPGRLYVVSSCTGNRVSVSGMKGSERVFWVMGEGCGEGLVFSGEKPFKKKTTLKMSIDPDAESRYAMIAYFIPGTDEE